MASGRVWWALAGGAVAALLIGAVCRPTGRTDRPVVWVFDPASMGTYTGLADVRVVPSRYLALRLQLRRLAGAAGGPAVAEIETGSVDGLWEAFEPVGTLGEGLSPARRAIWRDASGDQRLLPRDVHPVALLYRADRFRSAGLDVEAASTWDELLGLCRAYDARWAEEGRRSIEWPRYSASHLLILMQQGGWVPTSPEGWRREELRELVLWYAGWSSVGVDAARRVDKLAADLESGRVAAAVVADWRYGQLRELLRGSAGEYRLRALPSPPGAVGRVRTASWGGTGAGVPSRQSEAERARGLELLFRAMSDREAWIRRWERWAILPPVEAMYGDPRILKGDGWLAGRSAGEVFGEAAGGLEVSRRLSAAEQRGLSLLLFRAVTAEPDDRPEVVRRGLEALSGLEGGR